MNIDETLPKNLNTHSEQGIEDENKDEKNTILTERNLELLELVAIGLNNDEIAMVLSVAVGTVKVALANLFNKLDAVSRTDAVSIAHLQGLLPENYRDSIFKKYPLTNVIYQQKLRNRYKK